MGKDKITSYCLQFLVFAVPLVFTLWSRDVFLLVKWTLFQLVLLLLLFFWMTDSLNKGVLRILKNPLNLCWVVFILSIGLSIPFSYNKIEGLKSWSQFLSCWLLFLVVLNRMEDEIELNRLLYSAVIGGLFVSFYGILQYFGVDFFKPGSKEPYSTLGNVNFVAQYLVLILPLGFFLAWRSPDWKWKLFWWLTSLLILFCLILTRSKGAWLGIAGAGAIIILRRVFIPGSGRTVFRFSPFLIICGTTLAAAVLLRWFLLSLAGEPLISELSALFDPNYSSNQFRLLTWEGTWRIFIDHPVTGAGLDNFKLIYPAYRTLAAWMVTGRETEVFVAHNDYLQFAAETGVIGLAGFLLLAVAVLVAGLRHIKNDYWQGIKLAVAAAFTATFIHAFFDFNFQNPVPRIFLGLLSGLLALSYKAGGASNPADRPSYPLKEGSNPADRPSYPLKEGSNPADRPSYPLKEGSYEFKVREKRRLIPGIAVVVILLSLLILRPMAAEVLVVKSWASYNEGRIKDAIRLIEKSFLLMPNDYEGRFFAGVFYYDAGMPKEAIVQYKKSLYLHPNDPFTRYNLGVCYQAVGDKENAMKEFDASLRLNPVDPEAYLGIADFCLKDREYDRAIELLTRGLILMPLDARLHNNLGAAYELKGDTEKAEAEYLKTLRIDPENSEAGFNLYRLRGKRNID